MRAFALFGLAFFLPGCPAPDPVGTDAGPIFLDGNGACTISEHCGDGRWCNGIERCVPLDPRADDDGCIPGDAPCATSACDEVRDRCVPIGCEDADGDHDGFDSIACGGTDCDDDDGNRHPGATEVCNADDHDEDCDPTTFGYRDSDDDGSPDATCCNELASGDRTCGDDCDDMREGVHPGLPEVCDGRDNDCNGEIDEGVVPTFWPDADGDGHGTDDPGATTMSACFSPVGYSDTDDDCDDAVGSTHPGALDACDVAMVDDDCSGTANDPPAGCDCVDGTTGPCPLPGVCAAGVVTCVTGHFTSACSISPLGAETACDVRDEDCDGMVDDGVTIRCFRDRDNDTYPDSPAVPADVCANPGRFLVAGCPTGFTNREPGPFNDDCDDLVMHVFPRAIEVCDGVDGDCDGTVDEGVGGVCYADVDRDSYAPFGAATTPQPCGAACPAGTTARAPLGSTDVDCNDAAASVHPGATEICNRIDDDCSVGGGADTSEDFDGDGHAARTASCSATGGLPRDDCNDVNAQVFPGQTGYFTTATAGDPTGFDFDCSGAAERQYGFGGCAGTGGSDCALIPGWNPSGSLPACGASAGFVSLCNSGCFIGSSPPMTAACR